jgi:hypothetical protein
MPRQRTIQGKVRLVAMVQVAMICSEQFTLTVGALEGEFVGDVYDEETMAMQGETCGYGTSGYDLF